VLSAPVTSAGSEPGPSSFPSSGAVLLDLVLRHKRDVVARFSSVGDPRSPVDLEQLLVDAVRRFVDDVKALPEFEMDVYQAGEPDLIMTFVGLQRVI
jgi:hypothetical protein